MPKLITITRKIELRINCPNKEEKNAYYKKLKKWRDVACNGANMIISILYGNLKGEKITYMTKKLEMLNSRQLDFDTLNPKERNDVSKAEDKVIYELINNEKKELFETSEVNAYYRLLAAYYKDANIPSVILSCIGSQVFNDFTTDKSDYLNHNQSLRTYKKSMPIPFTSASIRNVGRSVDSKDKEYKDFTFTLFGIPFRTHFGRDRSNNYYLMNEAFSEWFLPDSINNAKSEEKFSELILEARKAGLDKQSNVYYLGDITLSIDYDENDNKEHFYKLRAAINDKEYDFIMKPMKPKKIAGTDQTYIPGYKIASNFKLCDSKIQLTQEQFDKDGGGKAERTKIFLLASLKFEERPWTLDPNKAAIAELDPEVPIKVTLGDRTKIIGSKSDLQFRRMGIQGAYRQTQRDLKFTMGGRGRKRKLQGLDRFEQYEKDVVKLKMHQYSWELVKYCLENNIKYLYLRKTRPIPDPAKTDEEKLLIRNWSFGQLETQITYKSEKRGIEVGFIEYETTN